MLRGLRSSVVVCVLLAFCFAAPASAARLARWTQLTKLDQVVDLSPSNGVTAVDRRGHVRQFANIPGPGLATGIAFDRVGHFRHRLLVTVTLGIESALYAINCHGRVAELAAHMPKVEGGMAVAPRGFGRFGGRLIAPDEASGHVYAIPPNGAGEVVAPIHLPVGGDVGVGSVGFVPRGFGR